MSLLAMWKQHTVTIEPHTGTNGLGQDTWGTGVPVRGWLEYRVKNIRKPDGSETVSTAQFHCDPGPDIPPRSRGTFPGGHQSLVVIAAPLDGGTLPLPSHLEISFE
jgi:hypothetical protein